MPTRDLHALKERLQSFALHGVARVALRFGSPVRAARVVRALGE